MAKQDHMSAFLKDRLVSGHRYFHWFYYKQGKSHLFNGSLVLFEWLFLSIMQPLGIYNHTFDSYWQLLASLLFACFLWLVVIYSARFLKLYFPGSVEKDIVRWLVIIIIVSNLFCLLQSYQCNWTCMTWTQYFEYYLANSVNFIILYTIFSTHARALFYKGLLSRNSDDDQLFLMESGSGKLKVSASDILFFKSDDNYVEIYIKSAGGFRKEVIRQTLKNIQRQLEDREQFVRIHRSYVVNLMLLQEIDPNLRTLTCSGGHNYWTLPVSAKYRNAIREHLAIKSLG